MPLSMSVLRPYTAAVCPAYLFTLSANHISWHREGTEEMFGEQMDAGIVRPRRAFGQQLASSKPNAWPMDCGKFSGIRQL